MQTIGVIGLGAMGGGVTETLLKTGRNVHVFDIDPQRSRRFAAHGAEPASSLADIADSCNGILLFLPMAPFDPALENLLLGEGNLVALLRPGSVLIDFGNTSPQCTRRLAEQARRRKVGFVDAPASGGETGARNGALSVMVGGASEDVAAVMPILKAVAKEVTHFGPVGMGQTAKLVNNMLVNGGLALLSEVLVFAERCGLDLEKTFRALSGGAAASWVLDNYGKGIIERPDRNHATPGGGFSGTRPGGRDKQLAWAITMADELETPLPMTSIAQQMFLMARGAGKKGLFEPVVAMLEEMTGADVRGHGG